MKVSTTAERLNSIMKDKKISKVELARRLNVNRSTIYLYLSGEVEPRQSKLYEMAQVLNVDPAYLMGFNVSQDGEDLTELNDIRKINEHADNLNKAIGLAMKQLRMSKHMSIDDLAKKLDRKPETLIAFENNETQIVALTIARYCKYLNYDVRMLLEDIAFIFDELENEK